MAAASKPVVRSDHSRLWLIEDRAGPSAQPRLIKEGKAGTLAWNQGNSTPIFEPDADSYGAFVQIAKQPGTPDAPSVPVTIRENLTGRNLLLRLVQTNCDHDWQIAIGLCKNPQDFNRGWEKKKILEAASISNYGSAGDIGALAPGDRNTMEETATLNGVTLYEVVKLTFSELLAATITGDLIDVKLCDSATCGGDCGVASDGCQKVFALSTTGYGGSPGVIYSDDGGSTGAVSGISTLTGGENPNGMACVGDNLVVVSEDSESIHYVGIAALLLGTAAWTEVTTGFVATKGPTAIYAAGPNDIWIAAEGGYIYFTNDPTSGVTPQTEGGITIQDLAAIKGIDNLHVVAVGASNTVLVTHDGGDTWAARTGPNVGVAATTVEMLTKDIYWVGFADGTMYVTTNDGGTWTLKGFTGSGAGRVESIVFPTRTVGFMSHSTATPAGRIFRTTNGGADWYLMPDDVGAASIPTNDRVRALAACDPNKVFGAGLAANGTDGFMVVASGE